MVKIAYDNIRTFSTVQYINTENEKKNLFKEDIYDREIYLYVVQINNISIVRVYV